ncbi:hypothetical protein GCM10007216_14160 [Thalassobacillus devorans]|uniref:Phosphomevalonate dehydratase small subunit-like domain-containing protein n=1 Tax=Thalassobacillus devorans TaxID=279813 RepID=A0ABQ1NUA9_9BACI|nr:DUF126 domain-containing protein [Thalassobacillus devorans]NIK28643.1 hypothetical protein [Thalassobacillus devorans]GGC84630.1 hypothetical protein GCM10007216_14160 [Thalassobacillus devorans]
MDNNNELKDESVEPLNQSKHITGNVIVAGKGEGEVIATDVPLSFWGGYNSETGDIIDHHHPLYGENLTGKVFVLPGGRGSCTGSMVLLQAIYSNNSPGAIILKQIDEIISLGAIVADEIFKMKLPIIALNEPDFALAQKASYIKVNEYGKVFINH